MSYTNKWASSVFVRLYVVYLYVCKRVCESVCEFVFIMSRCMRTGVRWEGRRWAEYIHKSLTNPCMKRV